MSTSNVVSAPVPSARPGRGWLLGTRGSDLARTQSHHVADLMTAGQDQPAISLEVIRTEGDVSTASLASLGGTGVFATALRQALLEGRVDLVVHSLKDLPTTPAPGLTIAAIPEREDARDALCARDRLRLQDLPAGARVGTGSPRRAAQLRIARPDIEIVDLRGNVPTRLSRVGDDLDGVVLAGAGLRRLELTEHITEYFEADVMLPAPGQGALAIEIADSAPPELARAVTAVDDLATRLGVTAERQVLATLEAGCAAPVGARAVVVGESIELQATAVLPHTDAIRRHATAPANLANPDAAVAMAGRVGDEVAREILEALPDGVRLTPDPKEDRS